MERVYWRVKVWTNHGETDYSKTALFEMGLLQLEDWKAKWIEPEEANRAGRVSTRSLHEKGISRKERTNLC